MNRWTRSLSSLGIIIVFLLTACQPKAQKLLPVTGSKDISLSAPVELARDNVLGYILSSGRLADLPAGADWQLDAAVQSEGEYHFRSGDWLMLIRSADTRAAIQRIVIINPVEKVSWTGYVTADGQVVDTAYGR
jgi:hypothetical protein